MCNDPGKVVQTLRVFCFVHREKERELSVGVNVIGARGGYYVFVTGVGVGGCVWGW